MTETIIVTGSGDENSDASSEAVTAAAEAVEEAAHALAHEEHSEDQPHHCDASCPCMARAAEHEERMRTFEASLAVVGTMATEAHANSIAAIRFAVEDDVEEAPVEEVTEVAPLPGSESGDDESGKKHSLLY